MSDRCGSTDTSSGDPCKWNEGERGPCPWHNDETPQAGKRDTLLEQKPEIKDIVAGALQRGDTVPEACSEAQISTDQYYQWRRRGLESDESNIFSNFYEEVTSARRVAGKQDRSELKELAKKNNDTRTLYKIHHDQYGDTYGKEEEDERETGETVVIHTNEQSLEQAQRN